jgi:hypothetical protein
MAVLDERTVVSSPQPTQRASHKRRRWPRVVLAVVLVVALGAGGFLIWAANYQPIAFGGMTFTWPGDATPKPGQPMTQYVADELQYGSTFIVYAKHKGDRFGFEYSIANRGPFGVTVLGLDKSTLPVGSAQYAIESGIDTYSGLRAPDSPTFRWSAAPVSLPKDAFDTRLGATFTYIGCPKGTTESRNGGGSQGRSDFGVRYRFLWFTHTAEVPMPQALTLVNGPHCG